MPFLFRRGTMKYENTVKGKFIFRDNRFIARVEVDGVEEKVHVPNTGRCRELFLPGVSVLLTKAEENSNRKTKYSLRHVEKNGRWINIDSQSPNRLVEEYLKKEPFFEGFGKITSYKREVKQGNSRLDFAIFSGEKKGFIEVKGVTLEKDGIASFPDAPTLRGKKHLEELAQLAKEGQSSYVFFVVQMKEIQAFTPNYAMDPGFSRALEEAYKNGVHILCMDTKIEEENMELDQEIPIFWQ